MKQSVGLEDLAEVAPEVHASLHKLLEYPPEVVDQLDLVFQVCCLSGHASAHAYVRKQADAKRQILGCLDASTHSYGPAGLV